MTVILRREMIISQEGVIYAIDMVASDLPGVVRHQGCGVVPQPCDVRPPGKRVGKLKMKTVI